MELRKEMETMLSQFESLFDFQDAFQTEDDCIAHLEDLRWHEVVVSPFDSTSKVYKMQKYGERLPHFSQDLVPQEKRLSDFDEKLLITLGYNPKD